MEWAGLIELAGRDQRTLTVCGNSGVRPPSQPLLQFSDPVSRTLWKTMTQTNSLRYLTFCANSGVRPPSQPLLQFSDPMSRTLWKTMTQTNSLRYLTVCATGPAPRFNSGLRALISLFSLLEEFANLRARFQIGRDFRS